MDVSKVVSALGNVHKELNVIIDSEWKARRLPAIRRLTQAVKALELAETHVKAAAERVEPAKEAVAATK